MTTHSTDRLLTAVAVGSTAVLVAVLAGRPEAAVFAAPWIALLALGIGHRPAEDPEVGLAVSNRRVIEGDPLELTTTVGHANGSVRVTHELGDAFAAGVDRAEFEDALHLEGLTNGGRAVLSSTIPARGWGRHHLGRARVDLLHPFGLFRTVGTIDDPAVVVVHPPPAVLRELLRPWLMRRITGAHNSAQKGRGVEFAEVRPYASGDSIRDINWQVSARSDELWVSERHPDRATDVVLMVDTFVESGHDARTVVGLAIEAATGLAESHLALSDRVGLIEFGGVIRWVAPGTGRLQLQRLVDGLLSTGLFANAADRDLRSINPQVLPPRSFVVALSPLLDARFVDALFVLAGRGHDVAVIECELASPATPMSAVQAVANRIWRLERQALRDRLAQRGVAVGSWRADVPLASVLQDLTRSRRSMTRGVRR